jgi:hypothetical protein
VQSEIYIYFYYLFGVNLKIILTHKHYYIYRSQRVFIFQGKNIARMWHIVFNNIGDIFIGKHMVVNFARLPCGSEQIMLNVLYLLLNTR